MVDLQCFWLDFWSGLLAVDQPFLVVASPRNHRVLPFEPRNGPVFGVLPNISTDVVPSESQVLLEFWVPKYLANICNILKK